jgi:hypothetical protein
MSSKKQTAVEWLVEQIHSEEYTHAFGKTYISVLFVDQAKEMIKEQIEWAYLQGYNDCSFGRFADVEKYYDKTFL